MRIYVNDHPRTFVVVSASYALVIRHPNPQYKSNNSHKHVTHNVHDRHKDSSKKHFGDNKVLVEFLRAKDLNFSSFSDISPKKSSNKQLQGFLGFLNVKGYIHLGFITKSTKVASPQINESIYEIDDVEFFCLNSDNFDSWIDKKDEDLLSIGTDETESSLNGYPAASVRRFLSQGNFYFSKTFDVSCNLQERGFTTTLKYHSASDDPYFRKFAWNTYMITGLIEFRETLNHYEREQFDETGFLTVIKRGYCKTVNVTLQDNDHALLTLLSKQACKKNGILFGETGCDDEGEVSNYVESEIIIHSEKFSFSYVIIRGNVPTFWELQSNFSNNLISSKNGKKVKMTRSIEASSHAFKRHFDGLRAHFGDIHIVNCLLQDRNTYKGQLCEEYEAQFAIYTEPRERSVVSTEDLSENAMVYNSKITFTSLPISKSFVKKVGYSPMNPSEVVDPLLKYMGESGAMFFDNKRNIYVGKQLGAFRLNSFDCLAKVDFVAKIICQEVIELAFKDMGIKVTHELLKRHAHLWAENDEVLKYLASNSTQQALTSSVKHSMKQQITKKYLSVLRDPKSTESAMIKLLGRLQEQDGVVLFNPLHQYLSLELGKRANEYSFQKNIKIFASTFNVNGTVYDEDNLKDLIFPPRHQVDQKYDLVFLGFQEMIELTPGKMISAKSDNFVSWEKTVQRLLNTHGHENYVSLWGCQMGGTALLLFITESQLPYISNIEGSMKKTGLGGMSANKGGVGVSFNYSKTLICLICSHLAAGFSNVEERHQNYKTIAKGIMFEKHKKVRDHDAVIWLGDFNFRIDLPIELVKQLIGSNQYQKLFEYDQLNKQMANGETFPFYDEMEITFPPTYKFDNNTKVYDTSEKQRVPAWTDRILSLSKNKILKQEVYDCEGSITFSDHRPVYAIYSASVAVVQEKKKREITHEIYEKYTKDIGDINFLLTASDVTKFVKDGGDDVMPPPSSEKAKWWLESGASAKVSMSKIVNTECQDNWVFNPKHPHNPFLVSGEPEIVKMEDLVQAVNK